MNAFWLNIFPCTLKEDAREWLISLLSWSIILWNDIIQKFTLKFFLPSQVHQIRNEAYTLKQNDLESYPETWERFKDYFEKCLNLDIPKRANVYIFYACLYPKYHKMIDASVGESTLDISLDNTLDLFKRIAKNNLCGDLQGKF